jgi:hypothetical protein
MHGYALNNRRSPLAFTLTVIKLTPRTDDFADILYY